MLSSAEQLQKIKRAIEMVAGVIKVERVKQLSAGMGEDAGLEAED
jgi:hypothetical protein